MKRTTDSVQRPLQSIRKWGWPITVGTAVLLCIVMFVSWLPIGSEWPCGRILPWEPSCEFTRSFSVDALLIDETFFFTEVTISENHREYDHDSAIEDEFIVISENGRLVGRHEVKRWSSSHFAREHYPTVNNSYGPPCGILHNLDYQSEVAEQFCAACSIGGHCIAVGQYQDYVSIFKMDLSPEFTVDNFIEILPLIDEHMAQQLGIAN